MCACTNSEGVLGEAIGWSCPTTYENLPPFNAADKFLPQPTNKCGSIIQVDSLVVGEAVPLVGTGDQLYYFSDRVEGRGAENTLHIPVLHLPFQNNAGAKIKVTVAGQSTTQSFPTATYPESSYWDFVWNGKDGQAKLTPGAALGQISYLDRFFFAGNWIENYDLVTFTQIIGTYKPRYFGLGGWQIGAVHFLDIPRTILYRGDGSSQQVALQRMQYNSSLDRFENSEGGGVYVISSTDGSEAYVFNAATGIHQETRSTRTGKLLKKFSYDTAGRLTRIEDAFTNAIVITRPTASSVLITSPRGQVTTLALNSSGWATSIKTPAGREYKATYKDAKGLLATFTKPKGAVSTFTYDSKGMLSKDQSTSGALWSLVHTLDPVTQNKSIQMTSGQGRKYTYNVLPDGAGSRREEIEPSGATLQNENHPGTNIYLRPANGMSYYSNFTMDDRFGQNAPSIYLQQMYTANGAGLVTQSSKTTQFDPANILALGQETVTSTNDFGEATRNYDGALKTYTFRTPEGRVSTAKISDRDQMIEFKKASFAPVQMTYNTLGQLKVINQNTRATQLDYDTRGLVSKVTDPAGKISLFGYNDDGEMISQQLPDGRIVLFTYDSNGNLTSVKPPSKPLHIFDFNPFDLPREYTAPPLGTTTSITQYSYNLDKQLTKILRPDASAVNFIYNATTGLLSQIQTPQGNHSTTYNTADQLTQLRSPSSVTLNWTYDSTLPLTHQVVTPGFTGTVEYTYQYLEPTSVSVRTATGTPSLVNFTYDGDRLLKSAGSMTVGRVATTGFVDTTQLGVVSEKFTYHSTFGELAKYEAKINGVVAFSEAYTRNPLGNVTTKVVVSQGTTTTFVYTPDSAGRLATVKKNGVLISTYAYDTNSNRLSVKRGTVTTAGTYNNQDQLLTYGSNNYTHTAVGDRKLKTVTGSAARLDLTYNALGALVSAVKVTPGTGGAANITDTYTYLNDGLGRKIQRSKNGVVQVRYVYDERSRLVGEVTSAGALKSHFVYAIHSHVPDYMIQNGVKFKFIHDQLGSVRMIVNTSTGAVVSRMDYDEFGILQSGSLAPDFSPFGFAGGMRDAATGLVRFGARDYDPESGRWTSKDPILFVGGDVNLYGYVMNDPVNFIDPNWFSARDVARIRAIFDRYVSDSTRAGERTSPGWLNNLLSPIKGYQGCGEQAFNLTERLNQENALRPFDDSWSFEIEELYFPNGTLFPIHQRVLGNSSNPSDPKLILDPHRPGFSQR